MTWRTTASSTIFDTLNATAALEPMSKRRRGYPSETVVGKGVRVVGSGKELREKLGRNDLCPCWSGRRFQDMLPAAGPLRRRPARRLLPVVKRPRPESGGAFCFFWVFPRHFRLRRAPARIDSQRSRDRLADPPLPALHGPPFTDVRIGGGPQPPRSSSPASRSARTPVTPPQTTCAAIMSAFRRAGCSVAGRRMSAAGRTPR